MHSPGILYLVATPNGNLGDMSLRAVEILKEVDFVICEDSRRSGMLLKHYEIKKPLRVFHDHTPEARKQSLMEELARGAKAALITDAGTPLISDPGFDLARDAIRAGIRVEAIPGPTALINALVISGLPVHQFTFAGYLPQKEKARQHALQSFADERRTLIFYESPYRVLKSLKDMLAILGDRPVSLSRELTKKFEETLRGKLSEVLSQIEKKKILGEYVIVIGGKEE